MIISPVNYFSARTFRRRSPRITGMSACRSAAVCSRDSLSGSTGETGYFIISNSVNPSPHLRSLCSKRKCSLLSALTISAAYLDWSSYAGYQLAWKIPSDAGWCTFLQNHFHPFPFKWVPTSTVCAFLESWHSRPLEEEALRLIKTSFHFCLI